MDSQQEGPAVQLPRWQSYKKVWGDKIIEERVSQIPEVVYVREWLLACGGLVQVSEALKNRVPEGMDPVGGYYVLYAGGFESWSPASAFEEGYRRI
jgi:hypothetical protein